jgi:hypothetical protein
MVPKLHAPMDNARRLFAASRIPAPIPLLPAQHPTGYNEVIILPRNVPLQLLALSWIAVSQHVLPTHVLLDTLLKRLHLELLALLDATIMFAAHEPHVLLTMHAKTLICSSEIITRLCHVLLPLVKILIVAEINVLTFNVHLVTKRMALLVVLVCSVLPVNAVLLNLHAQATSLVLLVLS